MSAEEKALRGRIKVLRPTTPGCLCAYWMMEVGRKFSLFQRKRYRYLLCSTKIRSLSISPIRCVVRLASGGDIVCSLQQYRLLRTLFTEKEHKSLERLIAKYPWSLSPADPTLFNLAGLLAFPK